MNGWGKLIFQCESVNLFPSWLALSCYRHCTVHTSESSQITVLNGGGFGLAPLGYWLCLAWCRLAIGCAWLGANWAWLLICFCLAMAAWAWLWLCLAINGYGLTPLGYWLCTTWRRLGLAINPLGLGYGRLGLAMAVLGLAKGVVGLPGTLHLHHVHHIGIFIFFSHHRF